MLHVHNSCREQLFLGRCVPSNVSVHDHLPSLGYIDSRCKEQTPMFDNMTTRLNLGTKGCLVPKWFQTGYFIPSYM